MIKNIIKTFLVLCLLQFSNGQMTITGTGKTFSYGKGGTLLINGSGFTSTISSSTITVGGLTCGNGKLISPTQVSCAFNGVLATATSTYEIKITQGGTDTKATVFKYEVPLVSDHFILSGNSLTLNLDNCPKTFTSYIAKLTQGTTNIQVNLDTVLSDDGILRFTIPQTILAGVVSVTLIDPFGFTHAPIQQTISSGIVSISPNVFDAAGTLVTVTGVFMGGSATVILGAHEIPVTVTCTATECPFTFTTTTAYESPLTITIKDDKDNSITTDVNNVPLKFSYSLPNVVSIDQDADVMVMSVTNVVNDITQLGITINTVAATITSFENNVIKCNIPHALSEGETIFALTAGPNTVPTNKLIAPIANGVTQSPAAGGSVTITGMFLKNSHVSTSVSEVIANEITCSANDNGESLICTMPAGSGDVTLAIVNYKDFANDPASGSEQTTIVVSYLAPTPIPTTPTPTTPPPTNPPVTESPSPTEQVTEEPSSSSKLLSTISLIIISISFILLI